MLWSLSPSPPHTHTHHSTLLRRSSIVCTYVHPWPSVMLFYVRQARVTYRVRRMPAATPCVLYGDWVVCVRARVGCNTLVASGHVLRYDIYIYIYTAGRRRGGRAKWVKADGRGVLSSRAPASPPQTPSSCPLPATPGKPHTRPAITTCVRRRTCVRVHTRTNDRRGARQLYRRTPRFKVVVPRRPPSATPRRPVVASTQPPPKSEVASVRRRQLLPW